MSLTSNLAVITKLKPFRPLTALLYLCLVDPASAELTKRDVLVSISTYVNAGTLSKAAITSEVTVKVAFSPSGEPILITTISSTPKNLSVESEVSIMLQRAIIRAYASGSYGADTNMYFPWKTLEVRYSDTGLSID